jgi:carbon storage regulator CsrA
MLALSRKKNEKTIVTVSGRKMEIKIIEIRNHTVRIGFQAPPDFRILREELVDARSDPDSPVDHCNAG